MSVYCKILPVGHRHEPLQGLGLVSLRKEISRDLGRPIRLWVPRASRRSLHHKALSLTPAAKHGETLDPTKPRTRKPRYRDVSATCEAPRPSCQHGHIIRERCCVFYRWSFDSHSRTRQARIYSPNAQAAVVIGSGSEARKQGLYPQLS